MYKAWTNQTTTRYQLRPLFGFSCEHADVWKTVSSNWIFLCSTAQQWNDKPWMTYKKNIMSVLDWAAHMCFLLECIFKKCDSMNKKVLKAQINNLLYWNKEKRSWLVQLFRKGKSIELMPPILRLFWSGEVFFYTYLIARNRFAFKHWCCLL